MSIKFTKHALERMRIRGITKEEIINAINDPNKLLNDSSGNIISHKLKIITAYKTSKMDKYL